MAVVGAATASAVGLFAGPLGWSAHAATTYDPTTDPYSMAATTSAIAATKWWDAGFTGQGIDVAVIDTGVAPVGGLDAPGKVLDGPDLSLESQAPAVTHLDTNGHGTMMAGLIAGHDSTLTAPYSSAPASAYRGMAPDARIISLKVAIANGGADVTQVIAAIDWVTQHAQDPGMNIRVLNLSYGTNSNQAAGVDPLAYAAEQAWKHGIVVVASAGNSGYQRGNGAPGLADPAYNPFVIGVGGYDTKGTTSWHDDVVGSYSASSAGCGASCKNPDFVSVGSHLQGLRVPNSFIDGNHPEGQLGDRYFRGSGTSEAAAMTSGAVALILQKYPSLTPDQVKRFIANNGQKVPGADSQAQGGGEINLGVLISKTPSNYTQNFAAGTGTGSLEGSRGQDHLSADGVTLTGEQDIFGQSFDAAAMAAAEASGSSWTGSQWNGSSWTGSSWTGSQWNGSSWTGSSWTGSSWTGGSWTGSQWNGSSWTGGSWTGGSWTGGSWTGGSWTGGSWTGSSWTGGSWTGGSWTSDNWS